MRTRIVALLILVFALPAAAQNIDIEALSGLQFNFGNPGARSLGMGGAFLGLADDASAAEANPAGLTILRKPEISIELRNYEENQLYHGGHTALIEWLEGYQPNYVWFNIELSFGLGHY